MVDQFIADMDKEDEKMLTEEPSASIYEQSQTNDGKNIFARVSEALKNRNGDDLKISDLLEDNLMLDSDDDNLI